MQDAISESTDRTTGKREIDGSTYYDVSIESPVRFSSFGASG